MRRIIEEIERRNLPYTVTEIENGSVILYAVGYAPFLYRRDQFELDAFYLTSNRVYSLSRELASLVEGAVASPAFDYKRLGEESGLGVRGANDLLYTERFGSLCALGAIYVEGKYGSVKLTPPSLNCDLCQKCVRSCPMHAIDNGFSRPICIREQYDSGVNDSSLPYFSKSVLGCNICSLTCPKNKSQSVLPPDELGELLVADRFFEACIKGRKALQRLGELIGVNYVRPAKLLTFAVYGINNVECDRKRWLDLLRDYPDERVRRAVSLTSPFVKE